MVSNNHASAQVGILKLVQCSLSRKYLKSSSNRHMRTFVICVLHILAGEYFILMK